MTRSLLALIASGLALAFACLPAPSRAYQSDCVWVLTFPQVQFTDSTLPEILQVLRTTNNRTCFDRVDALSPHMNIVLHESRLTPEQMTARISIDEKDLTAEELIYGLCKALGIGYRIDPYAIVISSRSHLGLPSPPSPRVASVPDGATKRFLVLFGRH